MKNDKLYPEEDFGIDKGNLETPIEEPDTNTCVCSYD
jgi:hypothetical protein